MSTMSIAILFLASFAAGIMNTIAGGGSFLTFPSLLFSGLDARAANITSTIFLFPMQVSSGFAGRALAGGTPELSFKSLFVISFLGGIIGAILLLATPPSFFAHLVPYLILMATALFAYGSFFRKTANQTQRHMSKTASASIQFAIGIYGGYFGGGIGFLMLAALTLAGMSIRTAGATKNILAAGMNASAVLIFMFSRDIGWEQVGVGAVASILGGLIGVRLLHRVNEKILRITVVVIGSLLTIAMFIRDAHG